MDLARRLAAFEHADLYVVITEAFCAGPHRAYGFGPGPGRGVGIVQLREKDLEDRGLYELALEFRRRTEAAGSLLIIDDRVDIALAAAPTGSTWARRTSPWPRPGVSRRTWSSAPPAIPWKRRWRPRRPGPDTLTSAPFSHCHQA